MQEAALENSRFETLVKSLLTVSDPECRVCVFAAVTCVCLFFVYAVSYLRAVLSLCVYSPHTYTHTYTHDRVSITQRNTVTLLNALAGAPIDGRVRVQIIQELMAQGIRDVARVRMCAFCVCSLSCMCGVETLYVCCLCCTSVCVCVRAEESVVSCSRSLGH